MKPLAWMRAVRDSDLPPTLKTTALMIGLRADVHGQCWPTYQQIADDAGADRRDIIRRVKDLREGGWLMIAGRSNGHGSQSNSYLLITPAGGVSRPTPRVSVDPPGGVSRPTPQGVSVDPPRSVTPKEVSKPAQPTPVENPHLAAVINLMAKQHQVPR